MKILLSLLSFWILVSVTAQTDILSSRSHSSNDSFLTEKNDNFGLPSKSIDSIIYIGNGCIIEDAGMFYGRDTFCNHPLFVENEFDEKKLKDLYPDYVVFVGFSKSERKKIDRENSMPWIVVLFGLSYLVYFLFPRLQSKKN